MNLYELWCVGQSGEYQLKFHEAAWKNFHTAVLYVHEKPSLLLASFRERKRENERIFHNYIHIKVSERKKHETLKIFLHTTAWQYVYRQIWMDIHSGSERENFMDCKWRHFYLWMNLFNNWSIIFSSLSWRWSIPWINYDDGAHYDT